ncbi:MAG TPA: caspase family protein, partial [Allocoleopsis sp.]
MCPLSLKTSDSTQVLATGKAKMWILLVGVNQYQDDHFPDLQYSAVDCQELGEALTDATREFPRKQVIAHHDFAAFPTFDAVYASLKQITSAARSQDTILFYFSGHGVIEQTTQQAVLCLSDTQNETLLTTGLPMQQLLQLLEGCAARYQLLWLDACHSGDLVLRGSKGLDEPTVIGSFEPTAQLVKVLRTRTAQSRGSYAFLSCGEGQRSWEFPELGHGVFTYYLIQGLRGEAADPQGVIEADGLYRYVYRQTVDYIAQKNQQVRRLNEEKIQRQEALLHPEYPPQTPKRIVEGVGELVLGLIPQSIHQPTNHSYTNQSTNLSSPVNSPIDRSGNSKTDDQTATLVNRVPPSIPPPSSPTDTLMKPPPSPSGSPASSPTHSGENTLFAAKQQLSVFGYTTLALAILAAGFALGNVAGNSPLLKRLNSIATHSDPCTLKVETLPE